MLALECRKQRVGIVFAYPWAPIHTLLGLPAPRYLHTQFMQRA
jgi:hypothetical protein